MGAIGCRDLWAFAREALIAALAALTMLSAHLTPTFAANRAFVVGINDYANLDKLAKAVNDATAMAATLTGLGYAVTQVPEAQTDRLGFFSAWEGFLATVKEGDTVVVFFAGHGLQVKGANYLMPRDVPKVAHGEGVIREFSIGFQGLLDGLEAKKPRVTLHIIDACRDNPFKAADGKRAFGSAGGLAELRGIEGAFVMHSAGANQQALDWLSETDADPNSVYTRRLLPLLRTPGLSLVDIAKRVQTQVSDDAHDKHFVAGRQIRHEQRPAYYDGIVGHFYPAGVGGAGAKAGQPALKGLPAGAGTGRTAPVQVSPGIPGIYTPEPQAVQVPSTLRPQPAPNPAMSPKPAPTPAVALTPPEQLFKGGQSGGPTPSTCTGIETTVLGTMRCLQPGNTITECQGCPEMVVIPGGSFTMGSPESEEGRSWNEVPQRKVTIKPFAAGRYEITFAEWDASVADGGCKHRPGDEGWGRGRRPVFNVSWNDAQEYVAWIAFKTKVPYRLLTEAEWEYAARAGTTTPFHFGPTLSPTEANYDGAYAYGDGPKGVSRNMTFEVGSVNKPNAFGLHDMHGNVWEWVEDCYISSYEGAPVNGSKTPEIQNCSRVSRGGSWADRPLLLRGAKRSGNQSDIRNLVQGFRIARTLSP